MEKINKIKVLLLILQLTFIGNIAPEKKVFDLIIGFSEIEQNNLAEKMTGSENAEDREFLVYTLEVDDFTGKINEINASKNTHMPIIDWTVQELINNIFPDMRKSTFHGETPLEQNGIGKFTARQSSTEKENVVHFNKSYDNSSYESLNVEGLNPPDSYYRRHLEVSKNGVVEQGSTFSEYTLGDKTQTIEKDGIIFETKTQYLDVQFKTNFFKQQETKESQEYVQKMLIALEDIEFEKVQLSRDSDSYSNNKFEILGGNIEKKSLQASETERQVSLVNTKILGQQVGVYVKAAYNKDQKSVGISIHAQVNQFSSQALTIISAEAGQDYDPVVNNIVDYQQTFFETEWQVFEYFSIPAKVSGKIYITYEKIGKQVEQTLSGSTKIMAGISVIGEGSVKITCVGQAGIYADGKFIEGEFALETSYTKTETTEDSSASIRATLNPVKYTIGGFHELSEVFGGSWWNPFKWCELQSRKYYPFYTGSLYPQNLDIFTYENKQPISA